MDNKTRQNLLKIIEDIIKLTLQIPREEFDEQTSQEVKNQIISKRMNYETLLEAKLILLKQEFSQAGILEDLKDVQILFGNNLFEYLTNQQAEKSEIWFKIDPWDYGETLEAISRFAYELISIINKRIKPDSAYETDNMKDFITSYVQGFIYSDRFVDTETDYLKPEGFNRMKELYAFYGLTLTESNYYHLREKTKTEYLNYRIKTLSKYEDKDRYDPKELTEFIFQDIQKRLNSKDDENEEETRKLPIEDPVDEMDILIKNLRELIEQYDEISKEEKELRAKLAEVTAKKRALNKKINSSFK